MKSAVLAGICGLVSCVSMAQAQDVYSGYDYSFEYEGWEDITLPEFHDEITDNVWIARAESRGIFNLAQEGSFQGSGSGSQSPVRTKWAYGTTADYDTLTYTSWVDLHQSSPPTQVNQPAVMYLEDDDIYIDIMFTEWYTGGAGGGFSYVRAAIPGPCIADLTGDGTLDIFDVFEFISLFNAQDPAADLTGDGSYDIFDLFEFISLFNMGCP
jgi:hypothetical protein